MLQWLVEAMPALELHAATEEASSQKLAKYNWQ